MDALHPFLFGILTMAGIVAALIFFRFYRMTADRLFLFFAAAFCGMALNWFALAMTDPTWEDRYQVFLLRLIAYAFILFGIIDKNRRAKHGFSGTR